MVKMLGIAAGISVFFVTESAFQEQCTINFSTWPSIPNFDKTGNKQSLIFSSQWV